jgi:hypothetical protein
MDTRDQVGHTLEQTAHWGQCEHLGAVHRPLKPPVAAAGTQHYQKHVHHTPPPPPGTRYQGPDGMPKQSVPMQSALNCMGTETLMLILTASNHFSAIVYYRPIKQRMMQVKPPLSPAD